MDSEISRIYGNRVRIRVCGLCWRNGKLLLINHSGLNKGNFWSPPGGGIEFGQTAGKTLSREFEEEAGIMIEPGDFLFACEFIKQPLHAIELFFEVFYKSGEIKTGTDPEMKSSAQIIQNAEWISAEEIVTMPKSSLHGIFNLAPRPEDLVNLTGYWPI